MRSGFELSRSKVHPRVTIPSCKWNPKCLLPTHRPIIVVPICVWIIQYLLGWFVFRDRRFPDRTININNQ